MSKNEELDLARAKDIAERCGYAWEDLDPIVQGGIFMDARAIRLGDEARKLRVVPVVATKQMMAEGGQVASGASHSSAFMVRRTRARAGGGAMTDTKALIAEARKRYEDLMPLAIVGGQNWQDAILFSRLAAALERAADGLTSGSCPTRPD